MTELSVPEAAVRPSVTAVRGLPVAALYAGLFALLGWGVGIRPLGDNSFLWHLRTGHWILSHGVPRQDAYSFTASGTEWIAQSWLAEAGYALADQVAGSFGIRLLSAATGAAVGCFGYLLAWRISGGRIRAALVAFPALFASAALWVTRPLLFGLAALLALVWIVELPESRIARRPLVAVPVVLWLWANVHGSFMLGFGYLGLHLAGRWLDGAPPWRGRERRLAQAGLLGLACCLINPYGWKLLFFPVRLMMRGEVLSAVSEWQSPGFRSAPGLQFGLWIAVAVVVLAKAGRRPTRRDLLIVVPFLLLALWAQRNILLAPVVALPVLARLVARAVDQPEPRGRDRQAVTAAVLALIVGVGVGWSVRAAGSPGLALRGGYPVAAMQAVERRGLLGHRLLTTDAWAGYVIYKYWPRQRVFIDDRYDMYPVRLAKEYFRVGQGAPGWAEVLVRHGVDVVVWNLASPLPQYLAFAPGWTRIYQDRIAVVFARVPPPS